MTPDPLHGSVFGTISRLHLGWRSVTGESAPTGLRLGGESANRLTSRDPRAKDCADCELAQCGLEC
eukprot:11173815-Alexandrium_andersonii.AAC.1